MASGTGGAWVGLRQTWSQDGPRGSEGLDVGQGRHPSRPSAEPVLTCSTRSRAGRWAQAGLLRVQGPRLICQHSAQAWAPRQGLVLPEAWGQSREATPTSAPSPQEFILSCLARDPARRPSAHNLLFHRVLFEVHSLKLLAAHCFIQHQYLMPENVVEEKTKAMDPHAVLAEIPRPPWPPLQWRYSEVSCLELDKFLEDVRNGIYPLMNFAAARPLGLPRVLAPPTEEAPKAKTPTPEPFDSETRKVIQMQCNLERSEDQARWHLTLLLVLEDRLHRQLTYDLLPTDSAQDLAAELVHYGFVHEDDRPKLAAFLDSTFLKYRGAQP
uniref:Nuclear receptor-binding protein 2 n=1 Tax=Bos mutus grunniens TaxID=30521 RepID=A0A8B9WS67_BOSMU